MRNKPILTTNSAFQSDLAPVRASLELWRKRRKRGERIPKAIWSVVVPLARAHGVNPVSVALHLDYNILKRRVALRSSTPSAADPSFVEVKVPAPSLDPCRIEIEDRCGLKMTLQLPGGSGANLPALVEAFWRCRS